MITFAPVVRASHRRQDGSYPVKIRVTFKRRSVWLPTNLSAEKDELTRAMSIRPGNLLDKCNELIRSLRKASENISLFALDKMDVNDVVAFLKSELSKETWHLDFFEWIDELTSSLRPTSVNNYRTAANALERFIGKRELDINSITTQLLLDFAKALDNEPKQPTTPKKYLGKEKREHQRPKKKEGCTSVRYIQYLGAAYRRAQDKFNDEDNDSILIPKSPFAKVHLKESPSEGQRPLAVDILQKMIDDKNLCSQEREAVDYFLLSLFLWGINMADLFRIQPPVNGILYYRRKKTENRRKDGARMQTKVPDFLAPIIERRKANRPDRWLALSEHYSSAQVATSKINAWLKYWAGRHEVPEFTFYAARHSFATIARSRKVGIDKAIVNECLCHADELRLADIYIERDWDVLNTAVLRFYEVFDTEHIL